MQIEKNKASPGESWNRMLDHYVSAANHICDFFWNLVQATRRSLREEDFRDLRSSFVVRVTIVGILLLFAILLSSCLTQGRSRPLPLPSPTAAVAAQKRSEPVYVKRETARISPRNQGSSTGSIFADSRRPTDLFSDESQLLPGDYLTVTIPEDLQFTPPEAPSTANGKNDTADELEKATTTSPDSLSTIRQSSVQPLKYLKMQIVGEDADGRVYVKATKTHSTAPGQRSSFTVTAHLPTSALVKENISALELTEVQVSSLHNGQPSLYQSAGWDKTISRQLSGYVPDVGQDIRRIESLESRISEQQRNLTERFRALKREQGRFKKEQARFYQRAKRIQEAQAQNAANPRTPPEGTVPTPDNPGRTAPADAAAAANPGAQQ